MAFNQRKLKDDFKLISTTEQSDNNSSTSRSIVEKKTIQILENKDSIPFRQIDKTERITNENTRKIYYQTTTTRQMVTSANPNFMDDFMKNCNLGSSTVTVSRLTGENKESLETYLKPNTGAILKQSKPALESDGIKIKNLSNTTTNNNRKNLNKNFSINNSDTNRLSYNFANKSIDKAINSNYISPILDRHKPLTLSNIRQGNNHLRTHFFKDLTENVSTTPSNQIKLNNISNTKYDAFKNENPKYLSSFSSGLRPPILDHQKPLTLAKLKPVTNQIRPVFYANPEPLKIPSNQIKLNNTNLLPKNPGKLYIFHHDEFKDSSDYREGSKADVELLRNTFKKYKIKSDEFNNFTVKKIRDKVEKISKQNFSQNSAILIAILSHGGGMDMIHAYDDKYSINDDILLPILTNKTLIGKPKILIVQACKGEIDLRNYDTDSSPRSTNFLTPDEIFKFYSTSEGFVSLRDRKTGSIFIKAFCTELSKSGHSKCIRSIMDDVTRIVKEITNGKQIPSMCVNNTAPYILGKYM